MADMPQLQRFKAKPVFLLISTGCRKPWEITLWKKLPARLRQW